MIRCRTHRRYPYKVSVLLAVFLFFLWMSVPGSPKRGSSSRKYTPPPEYDVAEKPRFLYRSRYRENPDYEYEDRVDSSLRKIEEEVLLAQNGDREGREMIWQIMLSQGRIVRSDDSIAFEMENDFWEYELLNHTSASAFVGEVFSEVPDLVWAYNSYPHDVLRADLLRYLLLWFYGGFYADLDVYPARSIQECPALEPLYDWSPDPTVSLVLGVEIDEPYASTALMHEWHWIRIYGFSQYTMYAPRRFSPLMRRVIVRVLAQTRQHYQQTNHNYFSWNEYDEATILEVTGPGVLTDAVLDGLSETLPKTHPLVSASVEKDRDVGELGTERRVTWAPFHRLRKPMFINASDASDMGGLGVLPVQVWANGQRHSRAGRYDDDDACVNHHFKGVWKPWKNRWWEYFRG